MSSLTFADNFLFHHAQNVSLYWAIPFFKGGMDIKIQGSFDYIDCDFFPGVSVSRYIFPGGKFLWFAFFQEIENLCQVSVFSQGLVHPGFDSRGLMSQTIIFPMGAFVFKILVVHTHVWIKKLNIAHYIQQCNFIMC